MYLKVLFFEFADAGIEHLNGFCMNLGAVTRESVPLLFRETLPKKRAAVEITECLPFGLDSLPVPVPLEKVAKPVAKKAKLDED